MPKNTDQEVKITKCPTMPCKGYIEGNREPDLLPDEISLYWYNEGLNPDFNVRFKPWVKIKDYF
jgi:hypothetical protein